MEKNDAQLIVIGSRGHSRIKEMFLGSTAFRILHSARVPVLLFRLEVVEQAEKQECRTVCDDVFPPRSASDRLLQNVRARLPIP